jgi:hypothetical protein
MRTIFLLLYVILIRYPFERITSQYPYAKLIRINIAEDGVSKSIIEKSVFIREDIGKVLSDILSNTKILS